MLNYGEELVYWYLRLNGFFLIDNFVLHKDNLNRTSDSDLLAVRFPYVHEEVGGRADDWDSRLFENLHKDKILGLICEVKTGSFNENDLFKEHNIQKAFGRFGFIQDYDKASRELLEFGKFETDNYQVKKLLVSRKKEVVSEEYIHISLIQIRKFISNRIRKYQDRKFGDRMFFPSSLLQYMIWEEQLKR
ncbi:hypothetical protein [Paenibacillus oryzisoli]|uniref:Uncharacterized protein n=1 Tax=Paenibacillus oryzisoli TaxID=1850517 RepID=A0A198A9W8_9BACL|nr:hypothetical protein [Paenibacillus oryzisoli]OAS17748.1 hypothetical protein A8708_14765 [Paenibacillus oryzisoli]